MRYWSPDLERFLNEEGKMAFVSGPRQVGKTTLAKSLLPSGGKEGAYFNWDIERHRKAILKDPEGFWQGDSPPRRITLDEIHKFPRWKRFLKGLYDSRGSEVQIIVTGSGRLDVYQRGGDSLFGRYGLYRLHPFTVGELLVRDRRSLRAPEELAGLLNAGPPPAGASEAFERIERFTGFPEPLFAASENRLRRWRRAHRALILREDLRDLTRIRELGLVDSLVELLPERVGSPLSVNGLREDLGVNFLTVQGWLKALERLYYIFEIRPYAGRLARALRREGKVYLFDASSIVDPGTRFENVVALHLLKLRDAFNDLGHGDFDLHYVRDKEKREADFLLTRDRKPWWLIETKLSDRAPARSLSYFKERLKPELAVQVVRDAPADALTVRDGILISSAARFLACLP